MRSVEDRIAYHLSMEPCEEFGSVDECGHFAIVYDDGRPIVDRHSLIREGIITEREADEIPTRLLIASAVIVRTNTDGFVYPVWFAEEIRGQSARERAEEAWESMLSRCARACDD